MLRSAPRGGACAGEAVNAGRIKKEIAYEKVFSSDPLSRDGLRAGRCGGEKTDDMPEQRRRFQLPRCDHSGRPAGTSGTYYAVGGVLKTVLDSKLTLSTLNVESTGASVANVNMITDGEAQMAILQSDVINYAHEGTNSFDGAPETDALWVAGIYNETVQILAKPGTTPLPDLKGKTVCVGDVGSGTEINAWQVLGAAGLTKDDVNAVNRLLPGWR